MPRLFLRWIFRTLAAALVPMLAACVAAPVFDNVPVGAPTPAEVAATPERYHGVELVWAGKILGVRNLADTTEVQVIGYPADASQRPDPGAPSIGRFIVVLPGYAEALDFPPGRFLTVRGRLEGTRSVVVDTHDLAQPLLRESAFHVWPVNFPNERARVSFGLGLGVGFH